MRFGGKSDILSQKKGTNKNRIGARIPEPNDNVTMRMGHKTLVDAVFEDTGLNVFLDGLKREQGDSVSKEVAMLVSNSAEMTGISVNRMDRLLESDVVRNEYGLTSDSKSIYRTIERIGKKSDDIVKYLGSTLRERYGVTMDTVFMDWTSMYFEAPSNDIVKFGHSRDHRSDRPQVVVGLSIDKDSGMPVGLTVKPGNILDVTHFEESFDMIRPFLPKDAMIVFDNGAYSRRNAAILDEEGFGFVTRMQMNSSDDAFVERKKEEWNSLNGDMIFMKIKGNLGRSRYVFFSAERKADTLSNYRKKAERDYKEMEELKAATLKGRKPRKKHRNGNCFIDTRLSHLFPLSVMTKENAIEHAVKLMTTGREGLFVLLTNRPLTASETLEIYRSRNAVESAFKDLKHGIDWRPARCTSADAVKGRILISFLSLFCMSMLRFLYPEFKTKTAGSISEELSSFALTVTDGKNDRKRRVWSNFTEIIRRISGKSGSVPVPKAPERGPLDRFC